MKRRAPLFISLLSALVALSGVGLGLVRADEIPESFIGTFAFSGGNAQRQALTREIDRVADQFAWISRGIARGRMHSEIRPEGTIGITRHNGDITFRFDQRTRVVCDGAWHPALGANEEVGTGKCDYVRGRFRYNERYDDGRANHALYISEDGRSLRMAVRISHPQLPDDIRYRLSFRRR